MSVTIGTRRIGGGAPAFVIAEIGLNHNGSVELAKRLIDVAADAGANAVKFQKRTPEISTPEHMRDTPRETPWGTMTYLEYRHRVEFGRDEYVEVGDHATLRGLDPALVESAHSLGLSRAQTLRRVTLPLVAPGISAGAVLCFARALGEFGATITFAGNFPGVTRTMPLSVYLALESDPEAAIVLALVLLLVSVVVLVALRGRWVGGVTP